VSTPSASSERTRIDEAAAAIRARDPRVPDIALVLGSGLSPYASTLVDATTIAYPEIPGWPQVGVAGHAGKLVIGHVPAERATGRSPVVAALAGRVHMYEGHSPQDVVFPIRVIMSLGAHTVVLTNAAGGISPTLSPGDLCAISDHINLQGRSPLTGPNDDTMGPRFPDMTAAYDPELRAIAHDAAARAGTTLREGVYAALIGPSYETPAEIRMLRALGADLVGMSTVPETIAARHMGARVLGISCVTNLAAGISPSVLSHAEVEDTARRVRDTFARLIEETVRAIPLRARGGA
jgi:purine-nucleoside phosphorylase